ncbi:hypothetical protein [Tessaracoccus antarcticus]|uniref:Uncharacterized protein n=1 Tax=Tessaracoccus antarcticus TaxID=2479848 RepID=A0A3M0GA46_9ACTN|nr:hypothetical protein [Tessaracoccus antarcticus]RMB61830.1 hypothetical protein EAX62_04260 [Tessaracoccus antarcticus]
MEEAHNPQDAFAFEFDDTGAVSAVHLADDWSTFVPLEEFGFALLMAYAEQHAEAAAGNVAGFDTMRPGIRYPTQLRDDVIDLSRDVSSLLKALGSWSPTQGDPVDVGDRHRHITIQSLGGMPNDIKINESWLRTADAVRIESDIVEAFRAMSDEAPKDEVLGQLAGLRERLADVVQRRNDHSRGQES